ncbi:hypothetical protein [Dickeya dadantii]|uniref:hypothetical protein n=1 Tax=Dickeya dadantii TaxID=204038 RepID=UPI0025432DE9|nr:hypothetical protein [Dickeya dadantii]
MLHKLFAESWIQGVLAGFPCGMPGIGLEIEGAVQQAPQSGRHSINITSGDSRYSFRSQSLTGCRPQGHYLPYRRFTAVFTTTVFTAPPPVCLASGRHKSRLPEPILTGNVSPQKFLFFI